MPVTLLDHLLKLYPTAKRTTLKRMLESGRVRINGLAARTLKQEIRPADDVKVVDRIAPRSKPRLRKLPFQIIHEDPDIIVIDKPPGLLTSTVPREKRPTAVALVREYVNNSGAAVQVGLIHRLDRDASGLIVFSKNHDAYLSLKRQFFKHTVDRIYLAVVDGAPNPRSGTIDTHLVERGDGSVHSTDQHGKGERAITHYETISHAKGHSHLRVRLQTGKKHQIRAHLSERGVPIVNDPVYRKEKPNGRLMLAAVELKLVHPRTGKPISFKLDPPAEFPAAGGD